jgi:hypothetical protein
MGTRRVSEDAGKADDTTLRGGEEARGAALRRGRSMPRIAGAYAVPI